MESGRRAGQRAPGCAKKAGPRRSGRGPEWMQSKTLRPDLALGRDRLGLEHVVHRANRPVEAVDQSAQGTNISAESSWEQGARKPDPWFLLQSMLYGDTRVVGVSRDMLSSFGDKYKLP